MAQGTVPLISSGAAGPLGAIHLPRLWQKLLLSANGELAEGYSECGKGFDQMLLDALKLNRDATVAYVKQNKPTYPQFEDWVRQQRGGTVPQSDIEESNRAIRAYEHGDEDCKEILEAAGMRHTGGLRDAVTLNNLEDWTAFHQMATRS
jgi:hypothetical protein